MTAEVDDKAVVEEEEVGDKINQSWTERDCIEKLDCLLCSGIQF